MEYEIQELKKFINNVCNKNICNATKEMALSHLAALEAKFEDTPPEPQHGREPDKVKPLAQYLDEYIEHEVDIGNISPAELYAWDSWRELLEQALDAYESTENVTIKIERNV